MSDTITQKGRPDFATTPRALLRDPDVSASAKTLWTLLEDFASPNSPSPYPGRTTLARCLGVSERTVYSWAVELVDHGWIEVERNGGMKTNNYVLNWRSDRKPPSGRDRKPPSDNDRKPASHEEERVEEERVEEVPPLSPPEEGEKITPVELELEGQTSLLGSEPVARRSETKTRNSKKLAPHAEAAFLRWWKNYPRKGRGGAGSVDRARREWSKQIAAGASAEELDRQLSNYRVARRRFEEVDGSPCWLMAAPKWLREARDEFDVELDDAAVFQRWGSEKYDAGVSSTADGVPANVKRFRDLLIRWYDDASDEGRRTVLDEARERVA